MSVIARTWPDQIDISAMSAYFGLIALAVVGGYFVLVTDLRTALRRVRGALMIVINYIPELPTWAREATPRCVAVFGLEMPCTEEELLRAYREKVKTLHPDRGGDRRKFLQLQKHFEQAIAVVREREAILARRDA